VVGDENEVAQLAESRRALLPPPVTGAVPGASFAVAALEHQALLLAAIGTG